MSNAQMNVQLLPVAKIQDNPTNARQHFDAETIEGLAADIKVHGLLNPLTVVPGSKPDTYVIKAGSRRYRAVKMLGWDLVPCNVRTETGGNDDLMSLAENQDRADLSAYEQAAAYARIRDQYQLTGVAMGKATGKDKNTVNNLLRLWDGLAPKVKAAWKDGHPAANMANLLNLVTEKDLKKQTIAWEVLIGSREDPESDEGDEDAGSARAVQPKAASAKKQAQTVLAVLARMSEKERNQVSALAVVQYVLSQRKTIPGLKLSAAAKDD